MRYKIVMERKALKFIKKQSPAEQKRLLSAINNIKTTKIEVSTLLN